VKIDVFKTIRYECGDVIVFNKDTNYGFKEGDIGVIRDTNGGTAYYIETKRGKYRSRWAFLMGFDIEYIGRLD